VVIADSDDTMQEAPNNGMRTRISGPATTSQPSNTEVDLTTIQRYSKTQQIVGLLGWLFVAFIAAAAGGLASANAGDFYTELIRPSWAPPGWLFGPVWSLLYVLMGIAAWLVWRRRGVSGVPVALGLFIVQLVLNGLWTWFFFVWRLGGMAFAEILLLWVLIALTTWAFWRVHRIAAALLMPYLAWVSFACALTLATWQLNPVLLG
jgi:benzodiazapine receptor